MFQIEQQAIEDKIKTFAAANGIRAGRVGMEAHPL